MFKRFVVSVFTVLSLMSAPVFVYSPSIVYASGATSATVYDTYCGKQGNGNIIMGGTVHLGNRDFDQEYIIEKHGKKYCIYDSRTEHTFYGTFQYDGKHIVHQNFAGVVIGDVFIKIANDCHLKNYL